MRGAASQIVTTDTAHAPIASSQAGVSEVITDGVDGLILKEPTDAASLARLISNLYTDSTLRKRLGENAPKTACRYAWSRNAEQLGDMFEEALAKKRSSRGQSLPDRGRLTAGERPTVDYKAN